MSPSAHLLDQSRRLSAMDSKQRQNILVVEDNENTRRLLETILRSSGYEVTLAPDAEEGLRILQGEAPVDLVLLDLFLPGADGVQFLRSRAEMEPDRQPPVIVVREAFPFPEVLQFHFHEFRVADQIVDP